MADQILMPLKYALEPRNTSGIDDSFRPLTPDELGYMPAPQVKPPESAVSAYMTWAKSSQGMIVIAIVVAVLVIAATLLLTKKKPKKKATRRRLK